MNEAERQGGEPVVRAGLHNLGAEKALLGAILTSPRAYERVSDYLLPEHFASDQHGRVFEACRRLIEGGQIADPVTLNRYFEQDESLAEVGGTAYLAELAASFVTIINATEYGRIIHDLYLRRQMVNIGSNLIDRSYASDLDTGAAEIRERAESDLFALAGSGATERAPRALSDSVSPALAGIQERSKSGSGLAGLPTGLTDLDRLLGGLGGGDLVIIAGATGQGKTALALGIAEYNAKLYLDSSGSEGAPTAFFSLEMPEDQLINRLLSRQTGISATRLRRGNVEEREWDSLVNSAAAMRDFPFYIDDHGGATVASIRARARRLKLRHNIGLIVVDYLQLLTADNRYKGQRVSEVSEMSRGLKILSMDLGVPVVALSQLSRAVDTRDNPRPRLSDIRESGSIEQDASTILFTFREEEYIRSREPSQSSFKTDESYYQDLARWESNLERAKGSADIIVGKSRHGETGSIPVSWDGPRTKFQNLAAVDQSDLKF